jgi:uncharacterized membrane protein
MNKIEFLDILSQTLKGEVSADVIEQNIRYYDQYISSQSSMEEAKIIEMLGDPRMIAKTVIEKDKAAKQKNGYHDNNGSDNNSGSYTENEEGYRQSKNNQKSNVFYTNLTWRQKLTLVLVLIIVILVLVFIGRIIIGFLFAFGVPILLILLLYALFKKRN